MNKKIIWVAIVITIVGLVIWTVAKKPAADTSDTGPIKIGAVLMLTGTGANYGEHSLNGATMAMEEINANGGVLGRKLDIVPEDNLGDNPAAAISAFNKLKSQGIDLMIGPNWSPSAIALAPIVCDKKVVMISVSEGGTAFSQKCDYTFNTYPAEARLSEALGKYVASKGYKNVAMIGSQQSWETEQFNAVKKGLEEGGAKLTIAEVTSGTETDFRTILVKMQKAKVDALILTNYTNEDITARQARDLGFKPQIYAVLLDDATVKDAEGSLEGAIGMSYFSPSKEFADKYMKEFGKTPDVSADSSYDAVNLIAEAIKSTGKTDSESVKEYLVNQKTFNGASGTGTFDEYGQVVRSPHYQEVMGGKLQDTNLQ